jgi:hypothetical protein
MYVIRTLPEFDVYDFARLRSATWVT